MFVTGEKFTCLRTNEFKCTSGFGQGILYGPCFPMAYVYDGINDCPDRSDECKL